MTDAQQKTILVAEDDKFLSKVYQTKLTKEGFHVILALDGEDTLKKLEVVTPNLILLDIVMPKKSGFEVLIEIKKRPNLKDVPIVMLTNLGQAEDIHKGLNSGANDYVVKSNVSINEVVDKVKKWIDTPTTEPITQEETSPQPAVPAPPTPNPEAPSSPATDDDQIA